MPLFKSKSKSTSNNNVVVNLDSNPNVVVNTDNSGIGVAINSAAEILGNFITGSSGGISSAGQSVGRGVKGLGSNLAIAGIVAAVVMGVIK